MIRKVEIMSVNRILEATTEQKVVMERGMALLCQTVQSNPSVREYFKEFDVDIDDALILGHGPDVYITGDDVHGVYIYGEYMIELGKKAFSDPCHSEAQAMASTLIHELAHWANDISGKNPKGYKPNPIDPSDGPYGYAAEKVTFRFILPP